MQVYSYRTTGPCTCLTRRPLWQACAVGIFSYPNSLQEWRFTSGYVSTQCGRYIIPALPTGLETLPQPLRRYTAFAIRCLNPGRMPASHLTQHASHTALKRVHCSMINSNQTSEIVPRSSSRSLVGLSTGRLTTIWPIRKAVCSGDQNKRGTANTKCMSASRGAPSFRRVASDLHGT